MKDSKTITNCCICNRNIETHYIKDGWYCEQCEKLDYMGDNKPDAYGRIFWIIEVNNYGNFAYYGTELEAEGRRRAKSNWEKSIAKKRMADVKNKQDIKLIEKYNI